MQAIEATVTLGVEHRNTCVVVAVEPRRREGKAVEPVFVVRETPRASTRIRDTCDLDGLLVERGLRVVRTAATHGCHRQSTIECLSFEKPLEKVEAGFDVVDGTGAFTCSKESLGNQGVVVRQSIFGPRPGSVRAHEIAYFFGGIVQKKGRIVVVRVDGGNLGCAERGVTHRPQG